MTIIFPTAGKPTTRLYLLDLYLDKFNREQWFQCENYHGSYGNSYQCGQKASVLRTYISPMDGQERSGKLCISCVMKAYPYHSFSICYRNYVKYGVFMTLQDASERIELLKTDEKYKLHNLYTEPLTPIPCECLLFSPFHWHIEKY